MTWCVNKIQLVTFVVHLDGGELDSNPLFAFESHRIQELRFHFTLFDGAS